MADALNLNELLSQIDWDNIEKSEQSFEDLPEGYYLCEVEKAELKLNKSGTNKQVSFQFKVVENGLAERINDKGFNDLVEIDHSKNRKIFKHYPLKDKDGVVRFVKDMLKFEGSEPGVPLLEKEYFMTEEVIPDALDVLATGKIRIYIKADYKTYNGTTSVWYDLIGWDRAAAMKLPL